MTEVITGQRGSGKTTALIKRCLENGGYIVCRNPHAVSTFAEEYCSRNKIEQRIAFPLTYMDFLNGLYIGKGICMFYIDDVDELLRRITKVPVEVITISAQSDVEDTNT